MHTTAYIDQALLPYFGSMIGFIQAVEKRPQGTAPDRNEEGAFTVLNKTPMHLSKYPDLNLLKSAWCR